MKKFLILKKIAALSSFFILAACSNDKEIINAYDSGSFYQAEQLCAPRIEKNDPKCLYLSGRINLEGNVGIRDIAEAAKMLKQAAGLKHRHAQLLYGLYAYRGEFEGEDTDTGLAYIREAAEAGLADAQFLYYSILKAKKEDFGTENALSAEEEKEMRLYLEKAALGGNVDAMINFAISYCVPDALKDDCGQKGIPMLEQAVLSGNVVAQRSLGIVRYSRNEFDRSVEPLKQAALQGDGEAAFFLGRIFLAGNSYEEGYKWVKAAAESGYKNAAAQLSVFYEPGAEKILAGGEKKYENLAKIIKYNKMILEKKASERNIKKDFVDELK